MTSTVDRRGFLKAMGIGTATLTASKALLAGEASRRTRPNVILVMTDDQGYGDLACLGNRVIKTPNLDKLHAESTRLTDFHVDPTCSPTRSALMTGRFSLRTGIWHTIMGRSLMRRDEVTMGDVFSANGYKTGVFGKWHLGDNYPFRPQDRGFGETLVHGGGGVGQTPDFWGNDYFDDTYRHNGVPEKQKGYCTDVWFDGAMKFIDANRNRPFFCYLPTNAPHSPFRVPEKYSRMYRNKKNVPNANFYGMITNIDENIGRLVKKLKELDLEKNTILIFMTDNGTSAGSRRGKGFNAGMRAAKGSQFDGGHRVPCFIRWPGGGIEAGRDINQISAHIDLLPTLIDLCNLKRPKGVSFDGASLSPLLLKKGDAWPDRTLFVDSQRIEHPRKWRKSAVMTQRWRLVNGKNLYDMEADPSQKKNVAAEHPDVVEKLRREYDGWWADVSKRFDEYCEIVIGSDRETPSRITCHDWHGRSVPWNQGAIRKGPAANGFWAVEVEKDGRYEFRLRRWPLEVKDKDIEAVKARLKIADADEIIDIPDGASDATFTVQLKAGKTRMQTWLTNGNGVSRGAYYVYVKRV